MTVITIVQTVLALSVITGILLQQRGAGLGGAIGGGGGESGFSTRRGPEKTIFTVTIIAAILFFGVSIVRLLAQ